MGRGSGQRFEHLDVAHAPVPGTAGVHAEAPRPAAPPKTLLESHRAIGAFLRWAGHEGYRFDGRILELSLHQRVPTEDLGVRLLVSSGIRWDGGASFSSPIPEQSRTWRSTRPCSW